MVFLHIALSRTSGSPARADIQGALAGGPNDHTGAATAPGCAPSSPAGKPGNEELSTASADPGRGSRSKTAQTIRWSWCTPAPHNWQPGECSRASLRPSRGQSSRVDHQESRHARGNPGHLRGLRAHASRGMDIILHSHDSILKHDPWWRITCSYSCLGMDWEIANKKPERIFAA